MEYNAKKFACCYNVTNLKDRTWYTENNSEVIYFLDYLKDIGVTMVWNIQ